MKRVLSATGIALAALFMWVAPATSQAAEHHGIGTLEFGAGGLCTTTMTYDGDFPGTGEITDLAFPNGCRFYGSVVTLESQYWEADFDSSGDVELNGDITVGFGNGPLWTCDYETTVTGDWNSGSPVAMLADGPLSLYGGSPICSTIEAMNSVTLSTVFVD